MKSKSSKIKLLLFIAILTLIGAYSLNKPYYNFNDTDNTNTFQQIPQYCYSPAEVVRSDEEVKICEDARTNGLKKYGYPIPFITQDVNDTVETNYQYLISNYLLIIIIPTTIFYVIINYLLRLKK